MSLGDEFSDSTGAAGAKRMRFWILPLLGVVVMAITPSTTKSLS
jgi:hypothetical protein